MTTHPLPQAPGWGDECWVIAPEPVPETCTPPTDLDEILELPLQQEWTVPMGTGVEQLQGMLSDLPEPSPERQAALDDLMTAPAAPLADLISWWLIGSAALTTIGVLAALAYLIYDRRSIQ